MSTEWLKNNLPTFNDKLGWLWGKIKNICGFIKNKWEKLSDDIKVFAICAIILAIIVDVAIAIKSPNQRETVSVLGTSSALASGVGNEITITLAGDIMCHDGQLLDARQDDGSYNFSSCFREVSLLIKRSDIAFANLEGTIAEDDESAYGYPYFFMPYEFAAEIVDTGFNVLSLNNTQCFNARETGLSNTIDKVAGLGAFAYGAGENGSGPIVVETEGIKVGFVSAIDEGYLDNSENGDMARDCLSVYDRKTIRNHIEYCRKKGADLVITYIRWGMEGDNVPTDYMKSVAEYLVSIGSDVVLGGGNHAVMPMEVIDADDAYKIGGVRKGYVFYSLGNFVSNQRTGSGDMGAVAELHVRKIAEGVTRVVSYETTPVYTNVDISDGRNFRVLPVYKGSSVPDWMDDTNKDRFIKVHSIVDTILNSFNASGCPY